MTLDSRVNTRSPFHGALEGFSTPTSTPPLPTVSTAHGISPRFPLGLSRTLSCASCPSCRPALPFTQASPPFSVARPPPRHPPPRAPPPVPRPPATRPPPRPRLPPPAAPCYARLLSVRHPRPRRRPLSPPSARPPLLPRPNHTRPHSPATLPSPSLRPHHRPAVAAVAAAVAAITMGAYASRTATSPVGSYDNTCSSRSCARPQGLPLAALHRHRATLQ